MFSKVELIGLIIIAIFIAIAVIVMAVKFNNSVTVPSLSASSSSLKEPIQSSPNGKELIVLEGKDYKYILTPKASYNVSALIKGKKKYDWDWGAQISPYDLLLVWGDLANTNIKDGIQYSQSGRWYHSRYPATCPYSYQYINDHAANTHIIPANQEVRKALDVINVNQKVRIEGYLIYLEGLYKGKTVHWRSSLKRTDSGDGACEVFYVEKISLIGSVVDNVETSDVGIVAQAKDFNNSNSENLTAEAYYEKGKMFFKNKDYKNAVVNYQGALKLLPDNVNIKSNLEAAKEKLNGL